MTHAFADAEKGAVGMIQVHVPKHFATMSPSARARLVLTSRTISSEEVHAANT